MFQLTVMLIGLIVIVCYGCINLGGILNVWSIAADGERMKLFK